jgi:mono/diheme cytochrome c family protein
MKLASPVFSLLAWGPAIAAAADPPVDFTRDVRPILERSCWKCHGPEKQQGSLRFDRREDAIRGGDSGAKAIVPGKPDESELIRRVEAADAQERMPAETDPLSRQQIKILRAWIGQGANWPQSAQQPAAGRREMVITDEDRRHWSYRSLTAAAVPTIKDTTWCRTPIDRFIMAALEDKKIRPNGLADRRTLIRRVYFDLIGLPPLSGDVETFIANRSPTAYEELVDRLLASPHYGERWGRHWLDVARYADSSGMEGDSDRPNAFHYRDFVIRALNDDLSYQTFVRWQIAGDECEPHNPWAISATGFLAAAPSEMLNVPMEEEKLRLRYNELDDMSATTALAFLGLTLGCARCHDHKFDAIPTRDYYRLLCAFTTTARRDVALPKIARGGQKPPMALAVTDTKGEPEPTWLFERGDFYAKKSRLELGFLTVLTGSKPPRDYWATARDNSSAKKTTYQRRALADWITDVEHGAGALLARVMVNRVWQRHFGEGIVRTVSDFGVRGERPTHPELLEWLAREFVSEGWGLKRLHRSLLTSTVYRQETTYDAARAEVDPDNRLLWRRRPQRLEAEVLRDAVLVASGTLNLSQFGPAFKPPIPPEARVARNTKDPYPADARDTPATRRRTVYMFHKRVVQHPLMQAFDGPDAATSCGRRNTTTVAPQALALLNDGFLRDRAGDFARRLLTHTHAKLEDCVAEGFRLAISRLPSDFERTASLQFLESQIERRAAREKSLPATEVRLRAMTDFCQALFGLNEFIYID